MTPDYRKLFRALPDPYLILLPNAPDFTIVEASDDYLRATLTVRETIVGKRMFDVFPDDPADAGATGMRNVFDSLSRVVQTRAVDTMAVQKYAVERSAAEGGGFEERHWSPVNTPILDESGAVVYIVHRATDVTEFVRLKQRSSPETKIGDALQPAQELEAEIVTRAQKVQLANHSLRAANEELAALDRAKTAFFSNISHEFRTPLTLMLSPLEDELADQSLPLARRERLEIAQRNALRLLALVNSLLDFARSEAGRHDAVFEPTDLAAFTCELASAFRGAAEKGELVLDIDCPSLPSPVWVDRTMWEKIVLNLLSNALKHTFEGRIEVKLRAIDDRVVLTVRDSGIGIAADDLQRVFERFHRVAGARSRSHEGSGIGLALVRDFVEQHVGTVSAESRVGEGTTFTVTLQAGRAHLPASNVVESVGDAAPSSNTTRVADVMMRSVERATDEAPRAPQGNLRRVLWVDDNADMFAYVKRVLAQRFDVIGAHDGAQALELALADPPDLVLSDVMMPVLDGFGLLTALRSNTRTRTIPIILLSARAGEEAAIEGLDAGADDYLTKPFSARELLSRVSTHIEMSQARRRWALDLEAANRELTRANRAKSDFLAMMSHELRTPLNAIIGFSEVLIDQRVGALNERQMRYVRNVHDGGKHLLSLINDLLDLSRIEAGRLDITKRPLAVRGLVAEATQALHQLAERKGITIELVEKNETLPPIIADAMRMKQVLYNLLSNAIKFTPNEGRITIGTSHAPSGRVRIEVTDTGMGIAPDELDRLFKAFSQLDNAKVEANVGTGLGLSLTKQLVELMGGTIGVDSTVGVGSCFHVELPAQTQVVSTSLVPATGAPDAPLVLVVDDDPNARELLEITLRGAGYRVRAVPSGEAAIVSAREEPPAIITLDVLLPGIDGWKVLETLRTDPLTSTIPIVFVTVAPERNKAFALGALDHVTKPIDRQALLRALARTIAPASDRPMRILVVDDEPDHLDFVRQALEPRGFQVRCAESGLEGIAAAREGFDAMLLDLMLPDLSGIEVVSRLRSDARTRTLPILLVTGHDLDGADRRRLDDDVETVLTKGTFGTTELVHEIARAVARRPL